MMKLFLCMLISITRSGQGYDLFLSPFIKPVVGLTWRSGWVFVESKIAKWKHLPVLVRSNFCWFVFELMIWVGTINRRLL